METRIILCHLTGAGHIASRGAKVRGYAVPLTSERERDRDRDLNINL